MKKFIKELKTEKTSKLLDALAYYTGRGRECSLYAESGKGWFVKDG
jgi:hypothetical protein